MSVYICIYFLILLFAINRLLSNTKTLLNFLLVIVGIFLCMGYMTGSDWRQYELIYETITLSNFHIDVKGYEYLYPILQLVFKSLGFTFWQFFIIIKLICYFVTIKTLKKYSQNNYTWGLLVFYAVFALDAYIDNPMRNLIASVIFLFSLKYLLSNKLVKYVIMLIIASSFHMSALLLIPIYFIRKIKLKKTAIIISLTVLFLIAIVGQSSFRDFLVQFIWGNSNFISDRFVSSYLHESFYEDNKSVISGGFIIHSIMFILIFLKNEEIQKQKYGILIFNLTFIYMIVYIISFSIWIFFRMRLFFFIPFCISISYIPVLMKKWHSKLFSISIIIIMSFFTMYSTITESYKYIPYTNHISYLFKNKPDYYERSNYNFVNSPYYN